MCLRAAPLASSPSRRYGTRNRQPSLRSTVVGSTRDRASPAAPRPRGRRWPSAPPPRSAPRDREATPRRAGSKGSRERHGAGQSSREPGRDHRTRHSSEHALRTCAPLAPSAMRMPISRRCCGDRCARARHRAEPASSATMRRECANQPRRLGRPGQAALPRESAPSSAPVQTARRGVGLLIALLMAGTGAAGSRRAHDEVSSRLGACVSGT